MWNASLAVMQRIISKVLFPSTVHVTFWCLWAKWFDFYDSKFHCFVSPLPLYLSLNFCSIAAIFVLFKIGHIKITLTKSSRGWKTMYSNVLFVLHSLSIHLSIISPFVVQPFYSELKIISAFYSSSAADMFTWNYKKSCAHSLLKRMDIHIPCDRGVTWSCRNA